jgi:N-acetyl-anhydromuramyl-L-alanine amidase AmpD
MTLHIDRTLRLPKTEYFPAVEKKNGIALHHTVGGTARSTFDWWLKNRANGGRPQVVGTAYLIDRDGTVYEVFEPGGWAFQFGLDWPLTARIAFEKRFIGIELASEGGLIEANGDLYAFDRVSPKTRKPKSEAFDYGKLYRGYRYFDRYEDRQVAALAGLIDHLCDRFAIRREVPDPFHAYYGDALLAFEGVIGHAMVRRDKSDPAPYLPLWNRLMEQCRVMPVTVTAPRRPGTPLLTDPELDELFVHNMLQLDRLNVAAGSLVKALVMELERHGTHIRLHHPARGGHRVDYAVVQGVKRLVAQMGRALGLKQVTDTTLEVHRG